MNKDIAYEEEDCGHICLLYEDNKEKTQYLTEFFRYSLKDNRLCVFITATNKKKVIEDFNNSGLDIGSAVRKNSFRVLGTRAIYEPNGLFLSKQSLKLIIKLIEDALRLGYSGLSTAGEMDWLKCEDRYCSEVMRYESIVNYMTLPGSNFKAICIYPFKNKKKFGKEMEKVMNIHPFKVGLKKD